MYISLRISISDITVLPHLVSEHQIPHEICSQVYLPWMEDKDFFSYFQIQIEGSSWIQVWTIYWCFLSVLSF
jgi:hypothetical protein